MKLTSFIFILSLMQVSAATFGQTVTIEQKDLSIDKVFREIRKQTGYDILMGTSNFKGSKINANFQNTPINEVMDIILKHTELTYSIEEKTIVIKKKVHSIAERVMNFFDVINIEGKIVDVETGNGIPRATIKLKNSNRVVVANESGVFRFTSLYDTDILLVSAIGYVTQEISAKDNIIVKLKVSYQELHDVIVSNGYQQVKQSSTTGSYVVVTAKDLESTPAINLMERLEGKVPGVLFDLRGNTIQIRGSNNYSVNTPPLIVIDGFPAINQSLATVVNGSVTSGNAVLSNFNIADIESITFLKDAAAAAIWGASAANGVIVITTKKGNRNSKAAINFGFTLSTSAPANFNNLSTMSNREYIDLEQEIYDLGYLSDPDANWRSAPVSEAENWMFRAGRKNPKITIAQRDSALNVLANRSNRDQIKDNLLQQAVTQQYNLSFSGGTENSSYYVSGSFNKDVPVFKSNYAKVYNISSNLTNDFLNKRLTLSTGLNYSYSQTQYNSAALEAMSTGAFGLAPYDMLVDDQGNKIYRGITFTTKVADSLTNKGYLPWTYNAIDELQYNSPVVRNNSIRFLTSVRGKLTDWLNATVSGQIQKGILDNRLLENVESYKTRELINIGTTFSPTRAMTRGVPYGAVYTLGNSTTNDLSFRGQFDINKTWNNTHHFDMIAGTEIRENNYMGSKQLLYGYDTDLSTFVNVNTTITGLYTTIYDGSTLMKASDGVVAKTLNRYLSYYANAGYSFREKYYITGSARFDDINVLGLDRRKRAKPLWSAGLRWDIKKEEFMKNVDWINSLSGRFTVGIGGNPPTSSNNYSTLTVATDPNTKLPSATILTYANRDLGWATTRMTNGGLTANLFKGRMNFTLDIFRKRTYGLMVNIPVNTTYGIGGMDYNIGDLTGRGIEFNVSGVALQSKDWSWSPAFNFSYNTTKVTDTRFPDKSFAAGRSLTTGYPVDNLFVYRWAGLDNTGQSQIYKADGSILKSTDAQLVKTEDRVYAGRTTAPYFGGFTNNIGYKNFNLLVRASYYLGHKFLLQNIDGNKYPTAGYYTLGLLSNSQALASRWRKPGDEAITNIPGIAKVNGNSITRYMGSDLNLRDAGNVMLQQISLNYKLPSSLLSKMSFIKGVNVGLTVSNLGAIWVANKEGINPNYQATDVYTNLPPSRNYLFNFNLSL